MPTGRSRLGQTASLAVLILLGAGGQPVPGQPPLRYVGQWVDGTRLTGDSVAPWHETKSSPKLADRELFHPDRPIRWLLDTSIPPPAPPEAMVEFFGGDCLPGRVIGFQEGLESPGQRLPPHLEVAPLERPDWPAGSRRSGVRVTLEWVRRIVWQRVSDRYQPRTLFLLDGRQLDFRSLRFTPSGVRLLRGDGIREVALGEIAELHMAPLDPWEAYFEQLTALGLGPEARLVRLETAWGLRAMGTTDRFRARAQGGAEKPAHWYHLTQPAWSLDPFWLAHESIRVREYFSPHEVPLSRIEPAAARQESQWGGPLWPWRADRSVRSGPLESGGVERPWGFGVHARTELEFPLPACARAFRAQGGLDRLAGSGGCVRAGVFLDSTQGKPLFASGPIVGSSQTFDTGRMAWEGRSPPSRLILEVDPAADLRPPGADPLDIRDLFDWLEPLVELDREKLAAEVLRRGPRMVPAWQNWHVTVGDLEGVRLVSHAEAEEGRAYDHGYHLFVATGNDVLRLSAKLSVRPYKDHLLLAVRGWPRGSATRIEVRVDGESIGKYEVPARAAGQAPPILVSLARWHGKQVTVELIQESRNGRSLVEWQAIALVGRTGAR